MQLKRSCSHQRLSISELSSMWREQRKGHYVHVFGHDVISGNDVLNSSVDRSCILKPGNNTKRDHRGFFQNLKLELSVN